jgi:hypothetical protein
MNIRPRAEELCADTQSFPQLRPVSQDLILAVGVFVPAINRRGLGTAKEHPNYAPMET